MVSYDCVLQSACVQPYFKAHLKHVYTATKLYCIVVLCLLNLVTDPSRQEYGHLNFILPLLTVRIMYGPVLYWIWGPGPLWPQSFLIITSAFVIVSLIAVPKLYTDVILKRATVN